MTIDNLIYHLESEFTQIPKGILNAESTYKDIINLTSINALILIALIDSAYDVLLTAEDIKLSNTIKDLFEIVKNNKINSI